MSQKRTREKSKLGEVFYMRASTPGHARSYCTAGLTATPSSLAARKTKCGSRKNWRASETMSALPSANMSFACCGDVIIPTAPTIMSGCAFLTASANGTCEKKRKKTGFIHATQFASPFGLFFLRGGDERQIARTWYPGSTGISCAAQFPPELTSIRSTPSFFSSPVRRMVCSMPHCSHFPSESFSGPSAQSEALSRTKRGLSSHTARMALTTRRKKRVRFSKGCPP